SEEGDAASSFPGTVNIDTRHLAFGAVGEVRFPQQHRKDGRLRGGLGIIAAAEPFAEAAIGAGPEPEEGLVLRRSGIASHPRAFERIAAFENLPLQITRGSRRPAKIFESIVVRLEF